VLKSVDAVHPEATGRLDCIGNAALETVLDQRNAEIILAAVERDQAAQRRHICVLLQFGR
jgi:hypothetical protein